MSTAKNNAPNTPAWLAPLDTLRLRATPPRSPKRPARPAANAPNTSAWTAPLRTR